MRAFTGGRRWIVGVAVAVVVLLGLGALVASVRPGTGGEERSGGAGSSGDAVPFARRDRVADAEMPVGAPAATDEASGAGDGSTASGPNGLGGLPAPGAPSRVVKTASVSLRVQRRGLDDSYGRVLRMVTAAGGFVVDSAEDPGRRASLTLRVPADRFEQVLADVRRVGAVTDQSVQGQDVSAEFVDIEARLRNWRAQEAVLLDLMRQARTIPDSIAVQQQLSQIQQQIEELEGRRRLIEDQTSFGTLTVALAAPGVAVTSAETSTLGAAWEDAVGVSLAVLGGTLVVLGAMLPLAVIAGIGLVGWVLVRRRRLPAEGGASVA